jgi:16S rRNA (cytidine1402-2'-O)-methyltransferase
MTETRRTTQPGNDADARPKTYTLNGRTVEAGPIPPGLYLVSTPIGNLEDVTLRALRTLAEVDLIACEDTRVTRKLLDRYGIFTALTPYHEHNAAAARPKILGRLAAGAAVALVSDAGTPLVSDPGFKLVRAAQDAHHPVIVVPGASAALAALCVAGLPTDRFFFEGFLPPKEAARRARIAELSAIPATLILFETGPRIAAALADLAAGLGDREATICRELTKLHEEVRRDTLARLARDYRADAETRGEFVIVVAPPGEAPVAAEEIDSLLRQAMRTASLKDAVASVAAATGQPRRTVYRRALELAEDDNGAG